MNGSAQQVFHNCIVTHVLSSAPKNVLSVQVTLAAKAKGLNVSFLSTENAISTYNYLVTEDRLVACAAIPPFKVKNSHLNLAGYRLYPNLSHFSRIFF